MMGIERVKKEDFFERDERRRRGTPVNCLRKGFVWILPSTASGIGCDQWNKLPSEISSSQGINTLKM